jgi:hypothetical protein
MAALPRRWRYTVAPAMGKEMFAHTSFPKQHSRAEWFTNSLNYYLSVLLFNAFPFLSARRARGQTLRYIGELLSDGTSVLIFPEGRRSATGDIDTFRPGIGMIASRLDATIVPVRIDGLQHVLGVGFTWRARASARRVRQPMRMVGDDYEMLAKTGGRRGEGVVEVLRLPRSALRRDSFPYH